jgi:hypothetical protein
MKRLILFSVLVISCLFSSQGQQFSAAIEDNSFFIEEAFNQELRIVQHISTGYLQPNANDFLYTFTQEWPLGGQTHQASLTIPYQSSGAGSRGFGDVSINYRFQLTDGEDWAWISPRLSLILPTGKTSAGLGGGVVGAQVNLPVSKRLSEGFMLHLNAGTTIHKTLPSFFFGGSGIWLLAPKFNVMIELLQSYNGSTSGSGNLTYTSQTIISPGIRLAIDSGDLQIVPGIAVPLVIEEEKSTADAFFYLSFEHPF